MTEALVQADRSLTVAEIISCVERERPDSARNPQATIRNALTNIPLPSRLAGALRLVAPPQFG